MITDQTEFLFRLPSSEIKVKVKFNANVWECWMEVDQNDRWTFFGEYSVFEEAIERCMAQTLKWS